MMKTYGVLIMPEKDGEMIKAKHWLVARGKTYKVVYIPIDVPDKKQPVIMTEFDWVDKLLYRLTFGTHSEKVTAFS